jgi:hypothetical protein
MLSPDSKNNLDFPNKNRNNSWKPYIMLEIATWVALFFVKCLSEAIASHILNISHANT